MLHNVTEPIHGVNTAKQFFSSLPGNGVVTSQKSTDMPASAPDGDSAKRVGQAIRLARMRRGLQAKDVADRMGIATQQLSQWETGARMPGTNQVVKLAEALGLDLLEWLASAGSVAVVQLGAGSGKTEAAIAAIRPDFGSDLVEQLRLVFISYDALDGELVSRLRDPSNAVYAVLRSHLEPLVAESVHAASGSLNARLDKLERETRTGLKVVNESLAAAHNSIAGLQDAGPAAMPRGPKAERR